MDSAPLLVFSPVRDDPRNVIMFLVCFAGLFAAYLVPPMLIRADIHPYMSLGVSLAVTAAIVLWVKEYGRLQAIYDFSYEFHKDYLAYKYQMTHGIIEAKNLPYFEIGGVKQVQNPRQSARGVADVHIKIISPGIRGALCGLFRREFFLYDIRTADQPVTQIQDLLDRYFKENPGALDMRRRLSGGAF